MKTFLVWICLGTLVVAGCAHTDRTPAKTTPTAARTGNAYPTANIDPEPKPSRGKGIEPIVTPDEGLVGKVARYNDTGRFVVMEFPIGHLPVMGQKLFVYRNGLKVGEVNVSGPQRDDHIVGDLAAGEAQAADEVRDR